MVGIPGAEESCDDGEIVVSPRLQISEQSKKLLDKVAELGIYGRTSEEVASRFVDEKLQKLVEFGVIDLEEVKGP